MDNNQFKPGTFVKCKPENIGTGRVFIVLVTDGEVASNEDFAGVVVYENFDGYGVGKYDHEWHKSAFEAIPPMILDGVVIGNKPVQFADWVFDNRLLRSDNDMWITRHGHHFAKDTQQLYAIFEEEASKNNCHP